MAEYRPELFVPTCLTESMRSMRPMLWVSSRVKRPPRLSWEASGGCMQQTVCGPGRQSWPDMRAGPGHGIPPSTTGNKTTTHRTHRTHSNSRRLSQVQRSEKRSLGSFRSSHSCMRPQHLARQSTRVKPCLVMLVRHWPWRTFSQAQLPKTKPARIKRSERIGHGRARLSHPKAFKSG